MKKHLNTLRKEKQRVVEELRNIRTKKLSKKWKVLYGIGFIGMIVLTTILLYPDNLFLAVLLTAGYGVSVPALSALIDSIKIKRLGKELNFIDTEIYTTKKEIQNQSLTDEMDRRKSTNISPINTDISWLQPYLEEDIETDERIVQQEQSTPKLVRKLKPSNKDNN